MSGIFISYRRQDTSGYAGRLYERLAKHFGKQRVFMDIDTLQPGLDFGQALDQAVSSCEVLIALIGPNWLTAVDAEGQRRLDNPDDFVRMEIAAALAREGVRVVPVLVGNASLPRADALPPDLKPLARRQSVEITDNRWDFDVARLIERLEPVVPRARAGVTGLVTSRWALATLVPVLLALVALVFRLDLPGDGGDVDSASTPTVPAIVATVPIDTSTSTPPAEPTPTAEAAAAGTPVAATPAPTAQPLAAAGITSETTYTSPQFGYAIEWTDAWQLDPDYNPPARSDDGEDSLYLSSAEAELSIVGSVPGSPDAVEQRIAIVTGEAYLSAAFAGRDLEILHAEGDPESGAVVVLESRADQPSRLHLIETALLDDGETLVSVHLVADAGRIEAAHAMVVETVTLDTGAPLGHLEMADIVAILEATPAGDDVATPDPTEEQTGTMAPSATPEEVRPATPVGSPAPDADATPLPSPTVAATPEATVEAAMASAIDPVLQAGGLVSEQRYESPQYGFSVEWDDTWMLDYDYDTPVISNTQEQVDAVHITTAELYTPFMRVAAYDGAEWGSMEEIVARLTSEEWLDIAYPGAQKQVVLQKYAGNRGGMVVSRTTDSGHEYIAIFEAHLVDDGETLLLVTMTTTPNQIASAHARTNETVRLDGAPPLVIFGVDEIVDAIDGVAEAGTGFRVAVYESPQLGYSLSWDGRWMPNETMAPAIGYDEATLSDFVNLRSSDAGDVLLKVGAVETTGRLDMKTAVATYSSEGFLTEGFGEDHSLLATEIRDEAGGIVVVHSSAGVEVVTIMESVLLAESSAMVTLIYTAPMGELDEVVEYLETTRATSLRLNGQPLPEVFDGEVIAETLIRQAGGQEQSLQRAS